jgi:Spy/CpxP family protein refolding chaperone
MKMKRESLLPALILLVCSAAMAAAAPPGKGKMEGRWDVDESTLARLDLTEEQQVQVQELRRTFHKETEPLRTQIFERKAELKLLWMEHAVDEQKIRALDREVNQLLGLYREKFTDYRLAFRGILSPEQFSAFLSRRSESERHLLRKGVGHNLLP